MMQINDYENQFETARTRNYTQRNNCTMPNKQGLGLRRLIRQKDGPALFGAWCCLIQLLSRQPKPRQGWVTDDGTETGRPLLPEDLELLTDVPARVWTRLFEVASKPEIGWILTPENGSLPQSGSTDPNRGSTDPNQGRESPFILNTISNSIPISNTTRAPHGGDEIAEGDSTQEPVLSVPLSGQGGEYDITQPMIDDWAKAYPGVDVGQELAQLRQWNIAEPTRRKTRRGIQRHIIGWLSRAQDRSKGGTTGKFEPTI